MSSDAVLWTYALAPDVTVDQASGGPVLVTPTSVTRIEPGELELLPFLSGSGSSEVQLHDRLRLIQDHGDDREARCAALLFRLDRMGLLARGLWSGGRPLAWCVPLRPPSAGPPIRPPEGLLRLSPRAFARRAGKVISLEAPAAWARMEIHDRDLLPLLHDLAIGMPAAAMATAAAGYSEDAILAILTMMSWCELFDASDDGWSAHDLLFHARTRRGYTRARLGKTHRTAENTPQPEAATAAGARRITLEPPDPARLVAEDPPFAWVSERRRSIRRYGPDALTSSQVSEFLFRTLHQRSGRRPYPSGGSCYPLQCYLAVHRCRGIAPGLHVYDPVRHELITVAEPGPDLDELLADAAATADVTEVPQIVLVLAAKYARTEQVYADLSYSLILKEVGAVFQAAMMAAAAMGLGACPLGCGNSLLFANLAGVKPVDEVSVGELMIGWLEATT